MRVVPCRGHVERFGALYIAVQREEIKLVDPVSKVAVIAYSVDHVLNCSFEVIVGSDSGLKRFSNVRVTQPTCLTFVLWLVWSERDGSRERYP